MLNECDHLIMNSATVKYLFIRKSFVFGKMKQGNVENQNERKKNISFRTKITTFMLRMRPVKEMDGLAGGLVVRGVMGVKT